MDKKELQEIIEQHQLWINTERKKGKRADLEGADLEGADFFGADWGRAKFDDKK